MVQGHRKKLPLLWLMTDERVGHEVLLAAAARLPKGKGGIVLRHYRTAAADRRALFDALARIARRRRLTLLLGGSVRQAAGWRADGAHGRDNRHMIRPMILSGPVHDALEAVAARRARLDLCFVSPLFPTRSHPGARVLGRARFAALAGQVGMPVIALGGMGARHRRMLKRIGADGWAAIDGLTG